MTHGFRYLDSRERLKKLKFIYFFWKYVKLYDDLTSVSEIVKGINECNFQKVLIMKR